MTTITRIGFCERCFKEGRPKAGDLFLVVGSSNKYKVEAANNNTMRGFTPHFYSIKATFGNTVTYLRNCCMCNCGTYLKDDGENTYLCINETQWQAHLSTLKDWNALVMFKDTGMKI